MTNRQILEKAIRLAIDGGWEPVGRYNGVQIIFNHDFAKALWGDKEIFREPFDTWLPEWQYHLQMMVIAPDPIEYLGHNL